MAPETDRAKLESSDLSRRVRAGDEAAFETIFRMHAGACLRFARSFVEDPEAAEDVVQEVFSWVWMHRAQWTPGGDILSYLLGATRNRALNRIRSDKLRARTSVRQAAIGVSPAMGVPHRVADAVLEEQEQRVLVRRVIAALPEHQRTLLHLRWQQGFTWAEIASLLSLSVDAVKKQHSRLILHLQGRLPDLFE